MRKKPDRDKEELRRELRKLLRKLKARQALFRKCLEGDPEAIKLWYKIFGPLD